MFLRKAQCTGEVRLLGAHIKGQLDCDEAVFSNPDGAALIADGLSVDGDMSLRQGAVHRRGPAVGAHIGGQLDCSEAIFSNPDGAALNADGLIVDAAMSLDKAQCTGEVRLPGAHIKASWTAPRPCSAIPTASP